MSGALTVKQLIAELLKCPENWEVSTEGCDCWGDAGGVEIGKDYVLITREAPQNTIEGVALQPTTAAVCHAENAAE